MNTQKKLIKSFIFFRIIFKSAIDLNSYNNDIYNNESHQHV